MSPTAFWRLLLSQRLVRARIGDGENFGGSGVVVGPRGMTNGELDLLTRLRVSEEMEKAKGRPPVEAARRGEDGNKRKLLSINQHLSKWK